MTKYFDEISLNINDYHLWLYVIGFYYLIVLIGENYKGNLCYFLNESKFGIKNIFVSILIFVSPFIHLHSVALLHQIGIDEIVVRASEIALIVVEILFVVAVGYWYLVVATLFIVVFLLISSILGMISIALFGNDIGILLTIVIMGAWYFQSFFDIGRSIVLFPVNFLKCVKDMIEKI